MGAQDYSVEEIEGIADIMGVQAGSWVENLITKSEMADLTSAEIVVSGGRALKSGENFSLLEDIAKTLGKSRCAIGASRAAVDAHVRQRHANRPNWKGRCPFNL